MVMAERVSELFLQNISEKNVSSAYAALKTLAQIIESSSQTTARGLFDELHEARGQILIKAYEISKTSSRRLLSVRAGTDMFLYHINKVLSKADNFETCRNEVQRRAFDLAEGQQRSMDRIATEARQLFKYGMTVLVHGYSRTVTSALELAAQSCRIKVLATECRPFCEGYETCRRLKQQRVPAETILDGAVASYMGQIDAVVLGAEAIVESGGVINRIGTYTIALIAKQFQKPVYVLAECLKFVRMYPLSLSDMPEENFAQFEALPGGEEFGGRMPLCDLTPPELITLLFTDLGILTPSAISDHLIQLYNG